MLNGCIRGGTTLWRGSARKIPQQRAEEAQETSLKSRGFRRLEHLLIGSASEGCAFKAQNRMGIIKGIDGVCKTEKDGGFNSGSNSRSLRIPNQT